MDVRFCYTMPVGFVNSEGDRTPDFIAASDALSYRGQIHCPKPLLQSATLR
jgi:hypothetical protein